MTYVVISNTPGYMPDDDPAMFDSLAEASEYLREEVVRYCESFDEADMEYEVSWTHDETAKHALSAYVTEPSRTHDLGRAFEIVESEDDGGISPEWFLG